MVPVFPACIKQRIPMGGSFIKHSRVHYKLYSHSVLAKIKGPYELLIKSVYKYTEILLWFISST